MPIQAVLFDLDGTLIDTAPDFYWVINQQLKQQHLPALEFDAVRSKVSNGAAAVIQLAFNYHPQHPNLEQKKQEFLALYRANLARHSALFPGMAEVLSTLSKNSIPWGIVTNKPQRFAQPLLEQLELQQQCGCLICPDHVTHTKPDPEGLYLAARELGVDVNHCCYVGDHQRDIDAAHNAGMLSIAAGYGYVENQQQVESWQAQHTIHHPNELIAVIA